MTKVKSKGYGVIAEENIKKGTLITEYVGEVITEEEKKKRAETR